MRTPFFVFRTLACAAVCALTVICGAGTAIAESGQKLEVTLFYSTYCKVCQELKREFIPSLEQHYRGLIDLKQLDISANRENLDRLLAIAGNQAKTPAVLVGRDLFLGKTEITENLEIYIEKYLKENNISPLLLPKDSAIDKAKPLSLLTVIGGGLVDSMNPCAFAVIIFFVSFLTVYNYKRHEIVIVGSAYCLSVFVTYILIGLGLLNAIASLSLYYKAQRAFYLTIGFCCFLFAAMSAFDFYKLKRGAGSKEMVLQLPAFLKKKINLVIGKNLRGRKGRSLIELAFISIAVGFLVSLLEGVCTGQVYVAIVSYIFGETHSRARGWFYLIIYNIMFIVPLVLIFILSLLGVSSDRFNQFLKRHLAAIKMIMALFFLALGIFILRGI